MGEIDTKPIESVQTALCLFGEKGDQRKNRPIGSDDFEKERELKTVLKDLANYKVQLEVKEAAYKQALLKLQHTQKTVHELTILLNNSDVERDRYVNECGEARTRIAELESEVKEMADQLVEAAKTRDQLLQVLCDSEAKEGELLCKEAELAEARDSELKALMQAELIEVAFSVERGKFDELMKQMLDLNDEVVMSKDAAIEAEAKLGDMRREMEMVENQLLEKSIYVYVIQLKLKEANEELSFSEKSAADAIFDMKLLQEELEVKERKNSSQEILIAAFKLEMNQSKEELKNANKFACELRVDVERLNGDLQKAKAEIDEVKERETEAQVEIALLKSELHRGRSKTAAAEAAEARAESVKSGLFLAVQQLAVEAESAKKENQMLKQAAEHKETEETSLLDKYPSQEVDASNTDKLNTETEEIRKEDSEALITISLKEYESLIEKAKRGDQILVPGTKDSTSHLTESENKHELEILEEDLNAAMPNVGHLEKYPSQEVESSNIGMPNTETEETRKVDSEEALVTISFEEYESLIEKAKRGHQILVSMTKDCTSQLKESENKHELEIFKDLNAAMPEVGYLEKCPSQEVEASNIGRRNTESEETGKDDSEVLVTISLEDYESLIEKAKRVDQILVPVIKDYTSQLTESENKHELENLKKELDAAMAKVAEFRNRAEQAIFRAEMAEKAKTAVEGQLRKWREERQKKKAALAALREASAPKSFNTSIDNRPQLKYYQPLSKVLNMKF